MRTEKIIMITTASLEEDFADGKILDAGQVKAIFERYGEDETSQYIAEDQKVVFDAINPIEIHLYHEMNENNTIKDMMGGYPDIYSDGNFITLSSLLNQGGSDSENIVKCNSCEFKGF